MLNLLLQLKYNPSEAKHYASIDYICKYGFTKDFPWEIKTPSASTTEEVKRLFYKLTALYLIIRKACNYTNPEIEDETLLNTQPLGINTPTLNECLAAPRLRVACVPLAGFGGNPPKLAMYFLIDNKGVWQEGVDPDGNSYRLAEGILNTIDRHFQEELFRYWIITGNLIGNTVEQVDFGNKPKLAQSYPKRRWLIPQSNTIDLSNVEVHPIQHLSEAIAIINDVNPNHLIDIIKEDDLSRFKKRQEAYGNLLVNADQSLRENLRVACENHLDSPLYTILLRAGIYDDLFIERCTSDFDKENLKAFLEKIKKYPED